MNKIEISIYEIEIIHYYSKELYRILLYDSLFQEHNVAQLRNKNVFSCYILVDVPDKLLSWLGTSS